MLLAKDIMTSKLMLVNRRATLVAAASRMRDEHIGVLPVVDRGHLVGMITDRDLAVRAMAEGLDPALTKVEAVMTQKVVSCPEDKPAEDLPFLMKRHGVHRLVVINDKGKPVGIVSVDDLEKHQLH
jgi:CBS domain-containing protein